MTRKISTESPGEMFKELVEDALARQDVDASEESTFYLVHLLGSFVRPDSRFAAAGADPDHALAVLLLSANQANPGRRVTGLRFAGDLALFLVGFLADGLRRGIAETQYYKRLGGAAYGVLAEASSHTGAAALFDELATNFARFADVLSEVSEACSIADDSDLLRLYERWQQTGSLRSAELLRTHGIHVLPVSDAIH